MAQKFQRKLKKIETNTGLYFDPIAKSPSQIDVGDILTFKYEKIQRLVLVVKPVSKSPDTGNLLLTCVNISLDTEFTRESAKALYKNRSSLGEDQYRTYIFNKIEGNLRVLISEEDESPPKPLLDDQVTDEVFKE